MVAWCPRFCAVPSESQNNLIWGWYSVKLFMLRMKHCWLPGQLTVVRCQRLFYYFSSFFSVFHIHQLTSRFLRQLDYLFSEEKKQKQKHLLPSYQPWLNFRVKFWGKGRKKYLLRNHLCIKMAAYWLYVCMTDLLEVQIPFRQTFMAALHLESLTSPSYLK